jgi:hypothetical protein
MKTFKTTSRLYALAVTSCLCFLAVPLSSASALEGSSTVTFTEPEKGETVGFVDNAPKASLKGGVASFSPGDVLVTTNPIAMEGKIVGKSRLVCTATTSGTTKNVRSAGFSCTAIARIPGGSLILVGELNEPVTEGAVTGGTGTYAGARGTFVSRRNKGFSTTTVTLLE